MGIFTPKSRFHGETLKPGASRVGEPRTPSGLITAFHVPAKEELPREMHPMWILTLGLEEGLTWVRTLL